MPVIGMNTRRLVLFIFIVFSFIIIVIIILDRPYTQNIPYRTVLYDVTEQNNIPNNKYFPRIHQPLLSSSILRAILIFYPNDQETYFLPELLWLYRSWIEMMKDEGNVATRHVFYCLAFVRN